MVRVTTDQTSCSERDSPVFSRDFESANFFSDVSFLLFSHVA